MDQNIGTMITQILPLLLLITVIIFITIMPQRKREKQVKQMLEEMKKGLAVVRFRCASVLIFFFDFEPERQAARRRRVWEVFPLRHASSSLRKAPHEAGHEWVTGA